MDKKATINPINKKDNRCFQYTVTVALNHEEIKNDLQRITKIKHFINICKLRGINFLSEKHDGKKVEKIDLTIPLNVLYAKKEKIYSAYISKHNSSYCFDDSQWIRMALSFTKKIINIIKWNNV